MAIGFARLEFVKRSSGKNACAKAAYNLRGRIKFHGTDFASPEAYDWSSKKAPVFHAILLPNHVNPRFANPEILWNAVERAEKRHDSQVALEMVIALPDDRIIPKKDKIHLAERFVKEHFVKNGLAAQIDIHPPEAKVVNVNGTDEVVDHNWHAHVVVTTRCFTKDGQGLEAYKARDLMPRVRGGKVISGTDWGKLWAQHQNNFFKEKGLNLQVEVNGVVPQKHLGPVRMRGRALSMLEEQALRTELNALECLDPAKILGKLTETRNVFTKHDVARFADKYIAAEHRDATLRAFWQQKELITLFDPKTHQASGKYTSLQALKEERQAMRLADRLTESKALNVRSGAFTHDDCFRTLTKEQRLAFQGVLAGQRLSCIEGHAGTGKSYLLAALRDAYKEEGYRVRALGPDNATIQALKEKGFSRGENAYRFLWALHHGHRQIRNGKEIWLVDESGKLGTRPLLEILKAADRHHAQVVLAGCSKQLSSVERGGLFSVFCERYGAQLLVDVQRQQEKRQREIAKQLARGEVSIAIDHLLREGGIVWGESRESAVEMLTTQWIQDRTQHPKDSSIVIAHSNAEVRALNEMIHRWRKEKGELGDKEYECQTTAGKVYASVGDRVEFRKNSRDLGVSNGESGSLIEASPKKFIVSIEGVNGRRQVTFDPREYRSFQLGYATTYYRSQGRTVDRAYVLHSPMMNKPMFYVGLTRHVKEATLFVSKEQAGSIMTLKSQLFREHREETLSEFTTEKELDKQLKRQERGIYVASLKDSDSFFERVKGQGLGVIDSIKAPLSHYYEKRQDKQPNRIFYQPPRNEDLPTKGCVVEVPYQQTPIDPEELKSNPKEILARIQSQVSNQVSSAKQPAHHDSSLVPGSSLRQQAWNQLPEEKRSMLSGYYKLCDEASALRESYQASHQGKAEWHQACALRNAAAHFLTRSLSAKERARVLSPTSLQIVQDRADRHEAAQHKGIEVEPSLEDKLQGNMEALLFRLFPNGPIARDGRHLRFGNKGSLSVVVGGPKAGTFYDFEAGKGGGSLQLIQRVMGMSAPQARSWAHTFLGEVSQMEIPGSYKALHAATGKGATWTAIQPTSEAPELRTLAPRLLAKYREEARYAYRDKSGNLLFYTLRLVDREDPSHKMVLPLSYGYSHQREKPRWRLKGYASQDRPLYNLHLLEQYPRSRVLIVEGEKAADAASKRFDPKKTICLSWMGGSAAAAKSNWNPLVRREVVIWPDNDAPGFKAADQICSELRRVGMKSLEVVDQEILQRDFPSKWDLADPLPKGESAQSVRDLILMAKEQAVSLDRLLATQSMTNESQEKTLEKLVAHDVLWRVEERVRPDFEGQGATSSQIRDAVLSEARDILESRQEREAQLLKQPGSDRFAKRLAIQIAIFQANHGREPRAQELSQIRDGLKTFGDTGVAVREDAVSIQQYAWDRTAAHAGGPSLDQSALVKQAEWQVKQMEKQLNLMASPTRGIERSSQIEMER